MLGANVALAAGAGFGALGGHRLTRQARGRCLARPLAPILKFLARRWLALLLPLQLLYAPYALAVGAAGIGGRGERCAN